MKLAISLIFYLCLLTSCVQDSYEPPDKEKLSNQVIKKAATEIYQETGLIPCGSGGRAMYEIKMLALAFNYRHEIEIPEGRKLVVTAVNRFVETINQNEEIRQYLANNPFTEKNVEIQIFLTAPNGQSLPGGVLHVVSSTNGHIQYDIEDLNTGRLKTIYQETYEEAVAKLANKESA